MTTKDYVKKCEMCGYYHGVSDNLFHYGKEIVEVEER